MNPKKNEYGKYLWEVLSKMFEYVDADIDSFDFDKENWYWEYEWDRETEEEFIEWLSNYLYTTTKARRELMRFPIKNKERCRKVAIEFNAWYGWKTTTNND